MFQLNIVLSKLDVGEIYGLGGRPKALDAKKTELAYQLYDAKKRTIKEICQMLGISKPSFYAYLEQRTSTGTDIMISTS